MRELIPRDDFGVFVDNKEIIRIDSLRVAEILNKRHDNILYKIKNLNCSEEFRHLNFKAAKYVDAKKHKRLCYYMTEQGFTLLMSKINDERATQYIELYLQRVNEMARALKSLVEARQEAPLLTEQIKLTHVEPKPYHYSNEFNMIDKLVLGMTAKKFREMHNIPDGKSIRPFLTPWQIDTIHKLQTIDTGLVVAGLDYNQRKEILQQQLELCRNLQLVEMAV